MGNAGNWNGKRKGKVHEISSGREGGRRGEYNYITLQSLNRPPPSFSPSPLPSSFPPSPPSLPLSLPPCLQLNSSMDECHAEFSSKETGSSLVETKAFVKAITDKKAFIQQATEVVLSHGRKLQDVLTHSRTLWPASKGRGNQTKSGRGYDGPESSVIRKAQSTEDLLEVSDEAASLLGSRTSSYGESALRSSLRTASVQGTYSPKPHKQTSLEGERRNSWDVLGSRESNGSPERLGASPQHTPGSPKVLVTPRRTRTLLKAATSVPALNVNQNQQLVQSFMVQIDGRLNQLILLWEGRRKGLEEAEKAVEFQMAVPEILEWIDTTGAEFLKTYDHYGGSMEEVRERR